MRNLYISIILLGALWLAGCQKEPTPLPDPVDHDPKTLIMFGKISGFADNLHSARQAVAHGALIRGQRLVVFHDTSSRLFEIVRDPSQSGGYREDVIKTYDKNISSLRPDRLEEILRDAMNAAPANHYALTVGVHGSGWIPAQYGTTQARMQSAPLFERPENSLTRAINSELEITDFAEVCKGMGFEFVLLDACFMSSIEALYDLRDVAPYIIASPTEIMMRGFPFDRLIDRLFDNWTDLKGICDEFVDFYQTYQFPCATIALIDTSELEELARTVRAVYMGGVVDVDPVGAGLQFYENMTNHIFYDLDHYMSAWAQNQTLYNLFAAQLDRTVIYKRHTARFYSDYGGGRQIPVTHFSGVSVYPPQPAKFPAYFTAYRNTSWYKYVYEGIE